MSTPTGSTVLFRVADGELSVGGCGSLACEIGGVATEINIITGVVFVGVAGLVALAYVQNAREACRHERRRVLDERNAFVEFADRVNSLDPVPVESQTAFAGGSSTGLHREIGSKNTTDPTLRQVVIMYRETVMSVPHYETEYDETVHESMAAELGPDATTSLATNGTLSPPTQRALVSRGREAADARTSLADAINMELNALSNANTELASIDRRRRRLLEHLAETKTDEIGAALDVWNQLEDIETEAETAATERQQSLREPPLRIDPAMSDAGGVGFYDYLYGGSEGPRHPVLAQVIDLITTIREDRDHAAIQIADSR